MAETVVHESTPADGVLLLTLSRPKARNAFTNAMGDQIIAALEGASRKADVRAVVVTGDPAGQAFCAGADLNPNTNDFGSSKDSNKMSAALYRDSGGFVSLATLRCTKPVIAAINGPAVGIGLAFPVACDMRVAAEDAKVGFPMAARGLVNESCSSYLLPRLVGSGIAKELVFTGRVFRARDAPQGLFNYVLPQDQVLQKAIELAQEIATTTSGMSVAMCKQLMDQGWDSTPEEVLLNESKCLYHVNYTKTGDVREGIAAFKEKRQPSWVHDAWLDLPDFLPFTPRADVRPRQIPISRL